MTVKGNLDDTKLKSFVDVIFENCSSYFNKINKEWMDALKKEPAYIRLKSISENQFYDATSNSSNERESRITRSCYAEMHSVIKEVHETVEKLISNKLNHDFHNGLEDLLSKTINILYPPKRKHVEESSEEEIGLFPAGNSGKKQKSAGERSSSEVISEDENVTFGSCSSVHTSDLSSFDDSLVFSSDEETGLQGKRMSLQAAEERLAELKSKKLFLQKTKQKQKNKRASKLKMPVKESPIIPQKSSRERKPNLKYVADAIISPLKKTFAEKFTTSPSSTVNNPLPRKRGRPRKHFT